MKRISIVILFIIGCADISFGQIDTMFTAGQIGTFSNSSGYARGYWFKAPSDFVITKLYVPTDASSGNQSIAVMKMNEIVNFSNSTNKFDLLYLVQDTSESGWITANIPVKSGDSIGILGYRSTINSYSNAPQNVTIDGSTVALRRLGMQVNLRTTSPRDVFAEPGFEISRVFFEYCTGSRCDGSCPGVSSTTVTNATSANSSDGSIEVDLDASNLRYLRWATKEGINYPANSDGNISNLSPGEYTLFVVSDKLEPCYLDPVTVGP